MLPNIRLGVNVRALAWIAAIPLLVVLMVGVTLVVAYVLGEGALAGVIGGAALTVLAWQAWIALALAWTFWVVPIGLAVLSVWARVALRDEED